MGAEVVAYPPGPRRQLDPLVQIQIELTINLIRQARRDAGITLRVAARDTGISYSTIAYIEQGRQIPALDTLLMLANYYGLDYTFARAREEGETSVE